VITILLIGIIVYLLYFPNCVYIVFDNGYSYKVYNTGNSDENIKAGVLLNEINEFGLTVATYLRDNEHRFMEQKYFIENILHRYNPDGLEEKNISFTGTSFTQNKGSTMVLCLRDKKTGKLQDPNTIKYVYLHELCHVGAVTWQHTTEFWESFIWLLKTLDDAGIYKTLDYNKTPKPYCGIVIDSTPYFST